MNEQSWPVIKAAFFSRMSFPIKQIAPLIARSNIKNSLYKHGIGRHSEQDILKIAKKTLTDLSVLLADKNYFFGSSPSTFDAAAFAFLAEVILFNLDNPLNRSAREFNNLVRYCDRINEQYYA